MKTIKHESPFPEWPGHVELPEYIDAQQFYDWYVLSGEIEEREDDQRPGFLLSWEGRFGFIMGHSLKLGTNHRDEPYAIEPTGLKLPSLKIAVWLNGLTIALIRDAQTPKNLQGRSDDTDSTTDS